MARAAAHSGAFEPFLLVGRIRKPHGVRGELFVWLETDQPDTVFRPGRKLWLGGDSGPDAHAPITVERAREFKGGVLLKVEEHSARTEVLDGLRGRSLYIPRAEAAPLGEYEVYYHELIGLRVAVGGEPIGSVREVYETPGPDLLAIERDGAPELLVPFVREMVRNIDLEQCVLEIEPPEGLLEL